MATGALVWGRQGELWESGSLRGYGADAVLVAVLPVWVQQSGEQPGSSGQWVPDDRRPLPSQVGPYSVEERYVPSLGCVVPGQVVPDDHAFTNLLKEHIHCLQEASKQPIDAGIIIGVGFSAAGGLGGAASIEVAIDLYDFE